MCASFNPSFTVCFFFSSLQNRFLHCHHWLNLSLLLGQPLHMFMWQFHSTHSSSFKDRTEIKNNPNKIQWRKWEDKDLNWQSPRLFKYSQIDKINDSKEVLTSNLFHNRLQKIKPHLKTKEDGVIISEQTSTCKGAFFIALLRFSFTYLFFPASSSHSP